MIALMDFLRLLRYAQARTSVALYQQSLERAKAGLAKAYAAHDAAAADLRVHDMPLCNTEPPPPPISLIRKDSDEN